VKAKGLITSMTKDHIIVNSAGRLSVFDRKGNFISMKKKDPFSGGKWFMPVGDLYVGYQFARGKVELFATVKVFNKELKTVKEIFRCQHFLKDRAFKMKKNFFEEAALSVLYRVYDNKIFIYKGGSNEFAIDVFDDKGEKLYTVKQDSEKIKLPSNFVKRVHAYFRIKFKYGLQANIKRCGFPENYPAIHDFTVADQKIYAMTYKREGNKNEVVIMDIKGNLLKRTMVPLVERNIERFFPFAVHKGKIYQLVEDEDSGNWELRANPIL
jgi:hypothetical protein